MIYFDISYRIYDSGSDSRAAIGALPGKCPTPGLIEFTIQRSIRGPRLEHSRESALPQALRTPLSWVPILEAVAKAHTPHPGWL